jgi:hypothetical protein
MKILGDLPPSSNVTGIIFSVAYCITKRPVGVEPVNAAFDTFFVCYQRSSKLSTKTINNIHNSWRKDIPNSIKTKIEIGVLSAGFRTTVFPAANAGASFQIAINIGSSKE